jgi:BirA family biotin operon repressor/biotin-[acetyl-CoA-carboxylase] ligase
MSAILYDLCMKDLAFRTLRLLADGEFRSGEDMARELGMSRASVWHAVRALTAAGLDIYKVRGRGYRLAQPLSLLDPQEIARELGGHADDFTIEVLDSVSSTNTETMRRAERGAPNALVVAAEWQAAGRGRMGRAWHAGLGGGLTFSVLWRFTQGAAFLAGLSLAVGVALARVCRTLGVREAGLKWPNDVVWHGRKLAGILIEMQGDMLGPSAAVIGIGVNVRVSEAVRGRIDQAVADLETACGKPLDRNRLLALLLRELHAVLSKFAREGLAPFREEWQRYHAHQNKTVALLLPRARRETGRVRGVAEDGALLLETSTGIRRYHSGEVSLREPHRARRTGPQAATSSGR